MEKDHKGENTLAIRQVSAELCQHLCRVHQDLCRACQVVIHPSAYADRPLPMAVGGGHCPMADGLGGLCSLGSAPALPLCLWDHGGLIKGGKATSRVTSAKHQLHVQCLRAAGTVCIGPLRRLPAAPEVLSESNHFPASSAGNCPHFWN